MIMIITYIYFQLHHYQGKVIFARVDFKVLLILGKYCSCLTLFKSFLNLEQLQQDFKHSKKYSHLWA